QTGGAEHRVTAAVGAMTGRAEAIECLLARMALRCIGAQRQHIFRHGIDILSNHVRPGHHEGLTPVTNSGLYLRRISAPLPVTAAQVREQVRLSLCFRSVADSAVAVEDALGYLQHLIVRLQLWQGLRADVVADLPELVSETVVVHLHLVALGPFQRATE